MKGLRFIRTVAWAAIVAIGLTAVGLFWLRPAPLERGIAAFASVGGPFALTTQEGRPFTEKDLAGKPYALFFGFTHCPEVCPTTLSEIGQALEKLGGDAERLNVVFVTVDPERDTPELVKTYLSSFNPRIVGLTGSLTAVDAMAKSYRVFYRKVPLDKGGYTMDHTAIVYLMDAQGRFVGSLDYHEEVDTMVAKLRRLVRAELAG